ncbi:MAG: biotin/lipoyl-binding protein, partial [Phycisphaerae bacterium]|nr:biotin/lipoyl-binding protein [Saprospiraceae bacterium]
MENRRIPVPVIVILVVVLLAVGYFAYQNFFVKSTATLKASGSIETTQASIGPEIGGKVVEVLVDEGQKVNAGDKLFRLDDTLLKAQRN